LTEGGPITINGSGCDTAILDISALASCAFLRPDSIVVVGVSSDDIVSIAPSSWWHDALHHLLSISLSPQTPGIRNIHVYLRFVDDYENRADTTIDIRINVGQNYGALSLPTSLDLGRQSMCTPHITYDTILL